MKVICLLASLFCLVFAALIFFTDNPATGFMLAGLALALALLARSDWEELQETVLKFLTWIRP
jgi:hypothetical protein